jgi:hypothetical protein
MLFLKKLRYLFSGREADQLSRQQLMAAFQGKYANSQTLLASNTELLGIIADIERKLEGQTVFGTSYIDALSMRCIFHTSRMVRCLEQMAGRPYPVLEKKLADIFNRIKSDAVTHKVKTHAGSSLVNVSLRSSALGEDCTLSFAGQYLTVLNVPPPRLIEDYRRIVASLFSPHAIAYRLHMAITFEDAVMAVACQEMIDALASGVMFTRNPVDPADNRILIDAVWGLGPFAVDGIVPPDTYALSKEQAPRLLAVAAVPKQKQLVADTGGQLKEVPVPDDCRQRPCLTESQACLLAGYGMRLEAYFGTPQDVEWALDRQGRLVVLQARPLRVHAAESGPPKRTGTPVAGHRVLMEDGGNRWELGVSGEETIWDGQYQRKTLSSFN